MSIWPCFSHTLFYTIKGIMIKKNTINIKDLNPAAETSLQEILKDISSIIPEKKMKKLFSAIQVQTDYVNELLDTIRETGLFINDIQNNRVYPNHYWYQWGYTDEEMKGMGFLKFVHPDDIETVLNQSIRPVVNKKMVTKIIFRIRTKKGDWRWILSSALSLITDKRGNIKQYIGFDYDITEEMEAKGNLERALQEAEKARKEAEASALEANTLREVSGIITSALDLNATIEAILGEAKRVIPFDTASVQILKNGRLKIIGGTGWKTGENIIEFSFPIPGENPNTAVIQSKEPLIIGDITASKLYSHNFPDYYRGKSWIGIPLIFRSTTIGMMTFDKNEKNFFTKKHQRIGKVFADHVAAALENARIYEEIKKLAMTDPLTGAKNRRSFFNIADQQEKIYKRYGTNFALIMLDLDFFKDINDQFGHQAGDTILQNLVNLIQQGLRDADILCRYGGEEFVILLPQSNETEAFEIAERIRIKTETMIKRGETGQNITVSLGCADMETLKHKNIDTLISMADRALYFAKTNGRNQSWKYSAIPKIKGQ